MNDAFSVTLLLSSQYIAVKAREAVEKVYPHIAAVDVDLELDDAVNIPSPMVQMKTHSTIVVER